MRRELNWNMVDGYCRDVGITIKWTPDWETRMWNVIVDKEKDFSADAFGGEECLHYQDDFYSSIF